MFSGTDLIFMFGFGVIAGMILMGVIHTYEDKKVKSDYENTDKIIIANNILLKISLWKMIIGFSPKDETGCYCADGCNFISDAFCRLGIESNTIDEQMALWKIERLDKKLGEL